MAPLPRTSPKGNRCGDLLKSAPIYLLIRFQYFERSGPKKNGKYASTNVSFKAREIPV